MKAFDPSLILEDTFDINLDDDEDGEEKDALEAREAQLLKSQSEGGQVNQELSSGQETSGAITVEVV